MPVVLLDHARAAMAKVLGDDEQRDASHHRQARPRMAQTMEADGRIDLGALAGHLHRPSLIGHLPFSTEKEVAARSTGRELLKELTPLRCQGDVAILVHFALADVERARIWVEV